MDGLFRELTQALERSQEDERRNKHLGELAGSIDLDEVLTRVLEAAGRDPGRRRGPRDDRRRGRRSRSRSWPRSGCRPRRPSARRSPARRTAGRCARSRSRYDYPEPRNGDVESHAGEPIRAGLAVPLPGETGTIGMLTVFTRSPSGTFSAEDRARPRAARRARGPGDRERAPLPRGAAARRPRRADRPAQPALLPRHARARGRPRPPLRPPAGADHLRPRRLQGDQRPHRPSGRRRGARRRGGRRPLGRAHGRHRLPRGRRRVRGHPARVRACRRPSSSTRGCSRRSSSARSATRAGSACRPAWPSWRRATTRARSSSAPTTPSTAPRKPARAGPWPPQEQRLTRTPDRAPL